MEDFLSTLSQRHKELKHKIHSFRIPLSPSGQKAMGFVYFTIPVIFGFFIMQTAIGQAERNLGPQGEKLKRSGIGASSETSQQNKALQAILDKARNKS